MSFAGVGYEEAMRRARDIVPTLAERAQKCEDARVLLPENEKLLHETGLFRYHQPTRYGGMELPYVAVVDIVAELARGCPSSAWNVGNLGCHHWILGYYEPETQDEVWRANPDVLIASSIALAAGRGRKTRDGFVVSGRWPFSSGVDNCDWNMLAVTVYADDGKTPVDGAAETVGQHAEQRRHRGEQEDRRDGELDDMRNLAERRGPRDGHAVL